MNNELPDMKVILSPTDFSESAANANEYAADIANEFNARLILLHAYQSTLYSAAPLTALGDVTAAMKDQIKTKMEAARKKLNKLYPGVSITLKTAAGLGAERILSLAKKENADMIVMGTTGTSKLQRLLLGSTTSKVIEKSECPVLCVPKDSRHRTISKIVFATDLQEDNLNAAATILPIAAHFNSEVTFIYVNDKKIVHDEKEVDKITKEIKKKVKYPKLNGYIIDNKDISKGIQTFLSKNETDVLVLFSHEKHFPGNLFSQNITKMMSYHTQIPLLALKSARPLGKMSNW